MKEEETDPVISREPYLNDVQIRKEFDLRKHIDTLIEDGMWIYIDQQDGPSAVTARASVFTTRCIVNRDTSRI